MIVAEKLLSDAQEFFYDCEQLIMKKNNDYSKGADALRNFKAASLVNVHPLEGILIRMTDKLTRVGNLIKEEGLVKEESIEDTLKDLANYSFLLFEVYKDINAQEQLGSKGSAGGQGMNGSGQ